MSRFADTTYACGNAPMPGDRVVRTRDHVHKKRCQEGHVQGALGTITADGDFALDNGSTASCNFNKLRLLAREAATLVVLGAFPHSLRLVAMDDLAAAIATRQAAEAVEAASYDAWQNAQQATHRARAAENAAYQAITKAAGG